MRGAIRPEAWRVFAAELLKACGLPDEPAGAAARGLVEGDLYGHGTHGLALLPAYVRAIDERTMAVAGRPDVIAEAGAVATWDAKRLPGIWTTALAVEEATARAEAYGLGAVAVRRSHHIGCLAAYLETPAREGKLVLVFSSDPAVAHVAPYGGLTPVLTPNPVAAGIPCEPDPIIVDVSTSITTAGMCARARDRGEGLGRPWLIDSDGRATDDPWALTRGGSILPIGGFDHGHKGFGLSLLVEALTQGLSGYGRADGPTEWGASVLVLAFSPARFGGANEFERQTTWLAAACRGSATLHPDVPVRLPGQLALARKRQAERDGLLLDESLVGALSALAKRCGIPMPVAD